MKKSKTIKRLLIAFFLVGAVGALGGYFYLNQGHRDVKNSDADYQMSAEALVEDFLKDETVANAKYLSSDGNSKIIAVTGTVNAIQKDFNDNYEILLMEERDEVGVKCSMLPEEANTISQITKGDKITIKGSIRAGAYFDEDLEMYENVLLGEGSIVK